MPRVAFPLLFGAVPFGVESLRQEIAKGTAELEAERSALNAAIAGLSFEIRQKQATSKMPVPNYREIISSPPMYVRNASGTTTEPSFC